MAPSARFFPEEIEQNVMYIPLYQLCQVLLKEPEQHVKGSPPVLCDSKDKQVHSR
jgi:hypothetical protein